MHYTRLFLVTALISIVGPLTGLAATHSTEYGIQFEVPEGWEVTDYENPNPESAVTILTHSEFKNAEIRIEIAQTTKDERLTTCSSYKRAYKKSFTLSGRTSSISFKDLLCVPTTFTKLPATKVIGVVHPVVIAADDSSLIRDEFMQLRAEIQGGVLTLGVSGNDDAKIIDAYETIRTTLELTPLFTYPSEPAADLKEAAIATAQANPSVKTIYFSESHSVMKRSRKKIWGSMGYRIKSYSVVSGTIQTVRPKLLTEASLNRFKKSLIACEGWEVGNIYQVIGCK